MVKRSGKRQASLNTEVSLGKMRLKNPVMVGSGTFGSGKEYGELTDVKRLGAIVSKTITVKPRKGNLPPRVVDTPSGMLNSIGLENDGLEDFIADKLPFMKRFGIPIVVSIAGDDPDEFAWLAKRLKAEEIRAVELNLSCPNLNKKIFAQDERLTREVIKRTRPATQKTLIAKLSPNVSDIGIFAKACDEEGADAVSLINTVIAMSVDIETARPRLGNITGGLSGPAIKPIALRMVWEAYNASNIPIIGMGGIMDYRDALEFIICGATAIAAGTANFVNPGAACDIINGLERHLIQKGIADINKLRGSLRV